MDPFNYTNRISCSPSTDTFNRIRLDILLWLIILPALAALVLNSLFVNILWGFTAYHLNLRLLLVHACLLIVWTCLGSIIKFLYIFIVLYTADNPWCPYSTATVPLWTCKLITSVSCAQPSLALSLSALGVGLERIYGLVRYRTYHKRTKRYMWLGVLLIINVIWIPSLIPQLYTAFVDISRSNTTYVPMPLCVNLLTFTRRELLGLVSFYTFFEISSALVWLFVYAMSRRLLTKISINRAQQSLAARFQLSQNFGVVRTVTPWVVFHLAFHAIILILKWTAVEDDVLNLAYFNRVTLAYSLYILQSLYGLFFPFVCVCRSKVLRTRLLKKYSSIIRLIKMARRGNTVQPDAMPNGFDDEKQSPTMNGFHMKEIRAISANIAEFPIGDKHQRDKRTQRIHVFSTLE